MKLTLILAVIIITISFTIINATTTKNHKNHKKHKKHNVVIHMSSSSASSSSNKAARTTSSSNLKSATTHKTTTKTDKSNKSNTSSQTTFKIKSTKNNFELTCKQGTISSSGILKIGCKDKANKYYYQSIDLNPKIANIDGKLKPQNGGYSRSCDSCSMNQGTILLCACRDIGGYRRSTQLDLKTKFNITNDDGKIVWK